MTDSIISDKAMRAAQAALDGLAMQQELIGQNLSNVDTPGYKAQTVDFQSALRRALNTETGPGKVEMATTNSAHLASPDRVDQAQVSLRKGGSVRADGNDVDIDVELTQMTEAGIQYQAITQLVSKKFLLLKNIVSGS